MKKRSAEISFKTILDMFLPKLWIICLVAVIAAAAFGLNSMAKDDTYTSTGKYWIIKVSTTNDEDKAIGITSGEISAMQAMMANATEIINTNDFAVDVISTLNLLKSTGGAVPDDLGIDLTDVDLSTLNIDNLNVNTVRRCISVVPCGGDTTCYYISVTMGDPALARVLAEVAGSLLVGRFKADTAYAVKIEKIDSPVTPTAPNSKGTVKNVVIGFFGGMVAAMFVIFLFSTFDVIVRSREKIEEKFDIPIIGVIPRLEIEN